MIPEKLLLENQAQLKTYQKDAYIFREGERASYYFQVHSGEVKMNNYNANGKEFIQSIFSSPRSFGEPPLFSDILYPANAIAVTTAKVFQLEKEVFLRLLLENPKTHLEVTSALAKRLYYKAIMASEISSEDPEHRIITLLDFLKKDVHKLQEPFSFKVDLTRQQIADLSGLRVETVIRATKILEKKNQLKIKNRKLYR
jgi:CRP-like cAMP-binding protein